MSAHGAEPVYTVAPLTEELGESAGGRMHISERTVGDVVIVDVSGKVTLGDGGDVVLKDKMQSLVQQGRKKVLLNLAEVSYVDSAGLGEIVQSYATVMKNGGALKLLNVTKRIKDLLSITKLLTVFECHDSEAEAVSSFSSTKA
jgi:anti-sigma B factor antagonist